MRCGPAGSVSPGVHRSSNFGETVCAKMMYMRGKATPDEVLQAQLDAIARAEGGPMEGTVPLRWLADPTWRCAGYHVSKRFVQGRRGRQCVFRYCGRPVHLTFPGDRSGYLDAPRQQGGHPCAARSSRCRKDGTTSPRPVLRRRPGRAGPASRPPPPACRLRPVSQGASEPPARLIHPPPRCCTYRLELRSN